MRVEHFVTPRLGKLKTPCLTFIYITSPMELLCKTEHDSIAFKPFHVIIFQNNLHAFKVVFGHKTVMTNKSVNKLVKIMLFV